MSALTSGDTFAGFQIIRLLGAGGMGEVYLAQHPRLPRRDALKILPAHISSNDEFRQRFAREADLASTLWHPHIVGVHDRGEFNDQLWISMDFVDGLDAAKLLTRNHPSGMPVGKVIEIVTAVAAALDYAHGHGLLHRDVKPANIMLSKSDGNAEAQRILLADFGIARNVDEASGLTATNMTVGTVAYAAPEQLTGETMDGRADQYALAATAYHLLSGSQLFSHSNPAVVIGRHLSAAPPTLADSHPELSDFDPILAVALAKSPEGRFARCSDFAQALVDQHRSSVSATAETRASEVARPSAVEKSAPTAVVRSRSKWLLPAVATAVGITVLAGAVFVWRPWAQATQPKVGVMPVVEAPVNAGPLTGVYAADFGPELQLSDGKVLNPEGARASFEIRSVCTQEGCVAVAKMATGPLLQRQFTLDEVGEQWIGVGVISAAPEAVSTGLKAGCEQGLSPEMWETLQLRTQPDGTFAGRYLIANANNCNSSRTITLTRTGDVDTAALPDPAQLPPRVPSPADGFHGRYRYTYSTDTGFSHETEGDVGTDCLRLGQRCMSYFSSSESAEPFVFADGRWTLHYANVPVSCGEGYRGYIERTAVLGLPQAVTDPFEVITGHGQQQLTEGPCVMPLSNYYLRFQRIGDEPPG
ncbi:serine/threonine-protein kinase [[Mycobacterium] crassicus]|uniref:non-specific serine/threonine protein kinase n=1 Tax=[Mycobacterium] crassicus TaxID=2872309 RepID=A0ABU5XDV9_9MYCO|nr:serine/threonine-protein kinase [Mycolicibacter sp. MYC098]MEB3020274.1 serine/threonine-protein kinase [Mycolicibacter sp. MYC098]